MSVALLARITALLIAAALGAAAADNIWSTRWAKRDATDAKQREAATTATLTAEKHYLNQIATAQRDHAQAKAQLDTERRRADTAAVSLRNAGTAYLAAGATDTPAACRQRAATLWSLFQEADRTAGAMAQAADEHAADVTALMQAWPASPGP